MAGGYYPVSSPANYRMSLFKNIPLSGRWLLFGLGTLLLNLLAHQFPVQVEQWYSRGLFQAVRVAIDWSTARLPFPTFYLFWLAVLAFWVVMFRRRPRVGALRVKFGYWLSRLLGFAGFLVGFFFWMWGFNYARVPMVQQIGLDVQPIDSVVLWQELQAETATTDSLRHLLMGNDTSAINDQRFWPNHAEDTVRAAVEKWLLAEGFPVNGHVRGRFIYPEGTLFKFGASGIYWPFVGEGNLEAGMHPLRKLPAMAHEMSHGYGFTDEGACNFIAYVACFNHPNHYLAYCARLDYWSTLASACRWTNPEQYDRQFKPNIPRGMVADIHAIHRQNSKFNELAPELRYDVYDAYLKAQGIAAGMLNYDEVLLLVRAWKKAHGNQG